MNWMINHKVKTPLGDGILQGRYGRRNGQEVRNELLVRIRITEQNRNLLSKGQCLTPRATGSALFAFTEGEVVL